MSRAIRILTATALLAVGALTFGATGASASPGHVLACQFAGLAGAVDPDANNDAGVESISTDQNHSGPSRHYGPDLLQPGFSAVGEDTDMGNYTFAGTATCIDSGAPGPPQAAVISSTGRYRNSVCGSGRAWSDYTANATNPTPHITIVDSPPGGPIEYTDIRFEIAFRGGQGTLDIQASHNGTPGGSGDGYVKIQPDAPSGGNCVTTDVTAFTVAGSFAVSF